MARNARLRICPRCGQRACQHDERLLADALATVETGTVNLDVCVSYRWVHSLRRYGRTSIVELKQDGEEVGDGQRMALHDMTGPMKSGFEQRGFIVTRTPYGIGVETLGNAKSEDWPYNRMWRVMGFFDDMTGVAEVVGRWLVTGELCWDYTAFANSNRSSRP